MPKLDTREVVCDIACPLFLTRNSWYSPLGNFDAKGWSGEAAATLNVLYHSIDPCLYVLVVVVLDAEVQTSTAIESYI